MIPPHRPSPLSSPTAAASSSATGRGNGGTAFRSHSTSEPGQGAGKPSTDAQVSKCDPRLCGGVPTPVAPDPTKAVWFPPTQGVLRRPASGNRVPRSSPCTRPWGYAKTGEQQTIVNAPVYAVMVRQLQPDAATRQMCWAVPTTDVSPTAPPRYVLRRLVHCGLCGRRMQAHSSHDIVYYRCRFPIEYGLANKVPHPCNDYLAERDLIAPLDTWLARAFVPHRLDDTITRMHAAQQPDPAVPTEAEKAAQVVAECDAKIARYREALEAGTDPALVGQWIT